MTATAYPPVYPPLSSVLRLAERVARLPHADVRVPVRARRLTALAAKRGWGADTASALAWREMDWLALYHYLGKTKGLSGEMVRMMAPADLLAVLGEE
jgi:hypothetical protein